MYWYRLAHPQDRTWLARAEAAAAWETLSPEEQALTTPGRVAYLAADALQNQPPPPWGTGIVAMAGRQPVGYILTGIGPDTSTGELQGHIFSVWVAPPHRRQGIGRRLTAMAEDLFARMGMRKAKIVVENHNRSAVQLANQAGYRSEGLIGIRQL